MIRNLRRSLIGLILLVLLAVIFNYAHIWYQRARSVRRAAQILSSEMARSFNRIEYSEYQKGVLRFRISATRLLESRQGKSFLEGIEACDFNSDGSIRNEIRSRRAEYDRERKIADFSGDVRLFLGRNVELRTESLHYDLNTNIASSEDKLQFLSEPASGSARGIRFDQDQESLQLSHDVDFFVAARKPGADSSAEPGKFHATSARAYCTEQMHRLVFQGGAVLKSDFELLSGDSIEAALSPERTYITSLISAGNAVYESGDSAEKQSLGGDRMVFTIGDSQMLEKISVVGQAAFSSASPEGEEVLQAGEIDLILDGKSGLPSQVEGRNAVQFRRSRGSEQLRLSGERLAATFAPGTKNLENMHVHNKAFLLAEGGAASARNELRADDIRMRFRQEGERAVFETLRAEGAAQWLSKAAQPKTAGRPEPERTLTASQLEMIYSRQGDSFESGSATGGVVMSESRSEPNARAESRRLLANHVRFNFFPGNNTLREMDADGNVRVIQEKNPGAAAGSAIGHFRTSSERMKVVFSQRKNESAVESMAQWGSFRYEDGSMSATSGRCDYNALSEKLILRESPRISDAANTTTGEWMEYDQTAGLLKVHGRVRSVLAAGKGKESFFTSSSSSSPAIITADEMQYWNQEKRARYLRNVQLLAENGQLQAGILDIFENGSRVEAQHAVRHIIPERAGSETPGRTDKTKRGQKQDGRSMVIQSTGLKYFKESNNIAYQGSVIANSGDIEMSSDSLDVHISQDGGGFEHATARGMVHIRQGDRICKGDTADYFLNPERFVLLGNPAEVSDPEKGKSFAGRLTSFIADDRILLENR